MAQNVSNEDHLSRGVKGVVMVVVGGDGGGGSGGRKG